MSPVLLSLAAPVIMHWQLAEVRGVGAPPPKLLIVTEEAVAFDLVPESEKLVAAGLASNIHRELEAGRKPAARLVVDYLTAVKNFPRVLFVRAWLRLSEGHVVRANYLSDHRTNSSALGFLDVSTGERVVLLRWGGAWDPEIPRLFTVLFNEKDNDRKEEAEVLLKAKLSSESAHCKRVAVEAAGRVEVLPCSSGRQEMGEALARLWPYLEDGARQRLGVMMQVAYLVQFQVTKEAVFPILVLLRGLAVPPSTVGLAEPSVSLKQLEPSDFQEFFVWELPSGDRFRDFWGKTALAPVDFSYSFAELLRRYF